MTAQLVFGVETEYAVSAFDTNGVRIPGVGSRLVALAANTTPHVFDATGGGMFLHNGARLYVDRGDHPEYATPECTDPWELVAHVRAGERLMLDLANQLADGRSCSDARIFRSNVDYLRAGATWGAHESYSHRIDPKLLPDHLIPHLVSRVIYTGAGGLNPTTASCEFAISPRAWLLNATTSRDTTAARGIYHLKNETLANAGWNRLHLICGESLCSDRSLALKVGTTALVVAAVDAGARPGTTMQLAAPLQALRAMGSDPDCQVTARLASGRSVRALDIQRHYLAEVERFLPALPHWAPEICAMWREQLDQLEQSPAAASLALDWAIKRALFDRRIDQQFDRALLPDIPGLLRRLYAAAKALSDETGAPTPQQLLANGAPDAPLVDALRAEIAARGLSWADFETYTRVVRELQELDLRFGELGTGIFEELEGHGVLDHRIVSPETVRTAMAEPPASTRAQLRGHLIRDLWDAGDARQHRGDWSAVWSPLTGRWLDLGDPFCREPTWKEGRLEPQLQFPAFLRRRTRDPS